RQIGGRGRSHRRGVEPPDAMGSRGIGDELLDLLFPPRCQVCGRPGAQPLCETCREEVLFIGGHCCALCGVPLRETQRASMLCADCRDGRDISGARAVGLHTGSLREAVLAFKFRGRTRLADPLAEMLVDAFRGQAEGKGLPLSECAALVPVPLHAQRRAWRGFDQAELLAERMAPEVGLPVCTDAIERVRNTTPQTEMDRRERLTNVRDAFEARRVWRLRGRAVILIDDVFTTGATIQECARTLRAAGAVAVYALTVTRAVPSWHPAHFGG
ncbi:MAG: double zinc ribbon domain-containing protein, partial [Armatimonadota bacterium]